MIPSDRTGNRHRETIKQTPIELTREILTGRYASSIRVDFSRFQTADIERKRQTQARKIVG